VSGTFLAGVVSRAAGLGMPAVPPAPPPPDHAEDRVPGEVNEHTDVSVVERARPPEPPPARARETIVREVRGGPGEPGPAPSTVVVPAEAAAPAVSSRAAESAAVPSAPMQTAPTTAAPPSPVTPAPVAIQRAPDPARAAPPASPSPVPATTHHQPTAPSEPPASAMPPERRRLRHHHLERTSRLRRSTFARLCLITPSPCRFRPIWRHPGPSRSRLDSAPESPPRLPSGQRSCLPPCPPGPIPHPPEPPPACRDRSASTGRRRSPGRPCRSARSRSASSRRHPRPPRRCPGRPRSSGSMSTSPAGVTHDE
jgi:hypothetical protein